MSFNCCHRALGALLGATVVALTGCAGRSELMTKAPSSYTASVKEDQATIVFFRDSGFAFAVNFAILDHEANFLGEAVARSDFSLQVPPGRYFFVAKGGEGTDTVQMEVAAGRAYYVRVLAKWGVWLADVQLDPIKPGEPEWPRLHTWLANTNHLMPLQPKAPIGLAQSALPPWAASAWAKLSPDQRARRTVLPLDGMAFGGSAPKSLASPPLAVVR